MPRVWTVDRYDKNAAQYDSLIEPFGVMTEEANRRTDRVSARALRLDLDGSRIVLRSGDGT